MENPLQHELVHLLNEHSAENASNTPDYILAQYMLTCLNAFNQATCQREAWYGRPLNEQVSKEYSFKRNKSILTISWSFLYLKHRRPHASH